MEAYHIRPATLTDIPFIVEIIVSAEKNGSPRLGLATLFDLSEERTRELIASMLEEEVDGCEFSLSSFLIAEMDGMPAGGLGGWVEGAEDDMPSGLLKANLIGFTFPPESIAALRTNGAIISGMQIPREMGSHQIEYLHVDGAFRGKGLAVALIQAHLKKAGARKAQVQTFSNNSVAIALHQRMGYKVSSTFTSTHPETLRFMPHFEKVLLEQDLHQ